MESISSMRTIAGRASRAARNRPRIILQRPATGAQSAVATVTEIRIAAVIASVVQRTPNGASRNVIDTSARRVSCEPLTNNLGLEELYRLLNTLLSLLELVRVAPPTPPRRAM